MNKFWDALFAKPRALKVHYKKAIKEENIVDLVELEVEIGIIWILIFLFIIL